jgi:hypothetical protein
VHSNPVLGPSTDARDGDQVHLETKQVRKLVLFPPESIPGFYEQYRHRDNEYDRNGSFGETLVPLVVFFYGLTGSRRKQRASKYQGGTDINFFSISCKQFHAFSGIMLVITSGLVYCTYVSLVWLNKSNISFSFGHTPRLCPMGPQPQDSCIFNYLHVNDVLRFNGMYFSFIRITLILVV